MYIKALLKAHVHWRCFFGENVSNSDRPFTCLGNLGRPDTREYCVSVFSDKTMLERLANNKNSNLLGLFVRYEENEVL
jgi:hypothetical protein